MRFLILPAIAVVALLLALVAAAWWRRGHREFVEADRLQAARSVTSLPRQPSVADLE